MHEFSEQSQPMSGPYLAGSWPLVSVVMPVRNEARFIKRSLESVLAQTYPLDRMEILVVDGMSDDGTREIVEGMISDLAVRDGVAGESDWRDSERQLCYSHLAIRIVDNPSRIVPVALNIGVEQARGDMVFRLDGHSEMTPDYVASCIARLQERPDLVCVGGPSIAVGAGRVGEAYALALRSSFGVGGRTFRTLREEAYVDTLAFGAYRKGIFAELGGFDPELQRNQDVEFSARLRRAGYRMLLIQGAQTLYHAPQRLKAILQQSYSNGYWNTKVLNKMIGVLSWRHFVPGIFVAALLMSMLAIPMLEWALYVFLLLGGSYLLSSSSASVSMFLRYRDRGALLLPLIFPAMHIGYGFGSVVGACEYAFKAGLNFKPWAKA